VPRRSAHKDPRVRLRLHSAWRDNLLNTAQRVSLAPELQVKRNQPATEVAG
jgi:hypothetical protein